MTEFTRVSDFLDSLAPPVDLEPDAWEDVLARAEVLGAPWAANGRGEHVGRPAAPPAMRPRSAPASRQRRGLLLIGLVALAFVLVVATAYALGHPVIDFGNAEKAPTRVVEDFGTLQVGAPAGMAPNVLPHQTRRITTVQIDGKKHVLWVAPTKQGGFCEQWSNAFGGCRANPHDRFAGRVDVSVQANDTRVGMLGGSFFQDNGERLEVSYADGTSDEIPFVWVTAPISAGFFLFGVPGEHRVHARRPVSVTLFDGSGKALDRESVIDVAAAAASDPVMHRLRGYGTLFVPAAAVWAERRQLFDLRANDGAHLGLWVAPARGGGTCFWTRQSGGCGPAGQSDEQQPQLALGFEGGFTHVNLCCNVGPTITRVEAQFQDGDRITLTPKEGFLLWSIPARHFGRGHRIDRLVGYDAAGQAIANRTLPTTHVGGLYPCAKPKRYGHGGSICP